MNEEEFKKLGFTQNPDGTWSKAKVDKPTVIDSKVVQVPPYIFIPTDVRSSKNSKQMFKNAKTGKMFITSSKAVKTYQKETKQYWEGYKKYFHKMIEGVEKPYILEFTFIRKTRGKWDFVNICQLPLDMMQEYGWLEDDDISNVLPMPPTPPRKSHRVDKEGCGFEVRVINNKFVNKY